MAHTQPGGSVAMTDKQLIKVAADFRKGILGKRSPRLMCMVVSAPLQGFLAGVYGVETTIETVWFPENTRACNHTFLRLPDGRILDATADQFGLEPIYLGEMPAVYEEWIWAGDPRATGGGETSHEQVWHIPANRKAVLLPWRPLSAHATAPPPRPSRNGDEVAGAPHSADASPFDYSIRATNRRKQH